MLTFFSKRKPRKKAAFFLISVMLFDTVFPTVSFALTSGPSQPEFSSFEPVATTNMVNTFTGGFTYNLPILEVPGANGGGYPLSLSYHAGASPEEEASWVGYGWTLNPGAINRNKRGFPDDWNGQEVKYWNTMPDNKTVSVGVQGGVEAFNIRLGYGAGLRYNNYAGFGYNANVGLSGYGLSLGYGLDNGDGSFSLAINPLNTFLSIHGVTREEGSAEEEKNHRHDEAKVIPAGMQLAGGSKYEYFTRSGKDRATNIQQYNGESLALSLGVAVDPGPAPAGGIVDLSGSYTRQHYVSPDPLNAFGYFYSRDAGEEDIMDYTVEKSTYYKKPDMFLNIPFNSADQYIATGEGVAGGFRAYNTTAGHFRPNRKQSGITNASAGIQFHLGLDIGAGAEIAAGGDLFQKLTVSGWKDITGFTAFDPVFRFNGDPGGYAAYTSNELETAQLNGLGFDNPPTLTGTYKLNDGQHVGRSSYIGYSLNKHFLTASASGVKYKVYEKHPSLDALVDRNEESIKDQIGEISVLNENGQRYNYGLPVYSRMENNLQYSLRDNGYPLIDIQNNYIVYKDLSGTADNAYASKLGEERHEPYATTYLLTSITDADYIDRTNNGVSSDDFGGYTQLIYDQVYGTRLKGHPDPGHPQNPQNWYAWRTPYNGSFYHRNALSDLKDDLCSISEGQKEVYYMNSIITKTHKAVFITSDREDGLGAELDRSDVSTDPSSKGNQKLKKLDRIELYTIDKNGDVDQLVKTVSFEYDYHVMHGVTNATSAATGKLTLKRVWFAYAGIHNATISPYEFEYLYPATAYPNPYTSMAGYGNGLTQNPDYSPFAIDAWGNYQPDGAAQSALMRPWLDQTPSPGFDPAAWQLKVVRLPSGGQIHVQYERNDYHFVQDEVAHVMVSLQGDPNGENKKFYINLADLGITTAPQDAQKRQRLRDVIQRTYMGNEANRMYYKYLYKLISGGIPELSDCNAEYITGYAKVKGTGIDPDGKFWIELTEDADDEDTGLPQEVCNELVRTQRLGMLTRAGDCNASGDGLVAGEDGVSVMEKFLAFLSTFDPTENTCLRINPGLSYLRIPVVDTPKKGGGIRVKRLLLYDPGIEPGSAELYGSEYIYQRYDELLGIYISSGVATNEPLSMYEECILAGKDKKQSGGPVGQTILPAPSVGYSRVVIKNIHEGETTPGFSVQEFHTAREYPVKHEATEIQEDNPFYPPIAGGIFNKLRNNLAATRGFLFELNNMHGQMKSTRIYAGDYDPDNFTASDSPPPTASVEQVYFDYKKGLPVMKELNVIEYEPMGEERDISFESRALIENSIEAGLDFQATVGFFGIFVIPYPIPIPHVTSAENELFTHVTCKVNQYPAFLKKTISFQDGIYHVTENVAFDPATGKPVIVKTNDGFYRDDLHKDLSASQDGNHIYTRYSIPASGKYNNFGSVARGEKRIVKSSENGLSINKRVAGSEYYLDIDQGTGSSDCDICCALNSFAPGDLVKLSNAQGLDELFHVDGIRGVSLKLSPVSFQGSPYSTANVSVDDVEIVRSGKTNQLNAQAGSITTYGPDASRTLTTRIVNDAAHRMKLQFVQFLNSIVVTNGYAAFSVGAPAAGSPSQFPDLWLSVPGHACAGSNQPGNQPPRVQISVDFRAGGDWGKIKTSYPFAQAVEDSVPKNPSGHFELNPGSGQMEYRFNSLSCENIFFDLENLRFCNDSHIKWVIDNVVSSHATTFSDQWPYSSRLYYPSANGNPNAFEEGERGKWRIESAYTPFSGITGLDHSNGKNYNAGLYQLELFNWDNLSNNDGNKWKRLNTITQYSPHGHPLEEINILGIKSAQKFGYHNTLTYLTAQNSPYDRVAFESFENIYQYGPNQYFEDNLLFAQDALIDDEIAHAGKRSLKIINGNQGIRVGILPGGSHLNVSLKLWARKVNLKDLQDYLTMEVRNPEGETTIHTYPFQIISQVGEWTLLESTIRNRSYAELNSVYIRYNFQVPIDELWIDDVRLQPMDAQVATYVYDVNTKRLLTSFDDQHFGLYYQYNAEGKLIRKIAETERGRKTLAETHYNMPGKPR